jgi:transcriptional regulator with XRE-family HTH domain
VSAAAFRNRARVGQSIAAFRRTRGLTQETFAEELDVSVRYIQSVEAGDENLTLDSLTQLAARLGLSLGALLREAFAAAPSARRRSGPLGYGERREEDLSSRAAEDGPARRRPPSRASRPSSSRTRLRKT